MATSVKVMTPIPTFDQVARSMRVPKARKEAILRLAQDTVDHYYREDALKTKKNSTKKAKAA